MEKPSGLWFVLSGTLTVYEPIGSENLILNQIEPGMSCADPEMNVTVSLKATLQVGNQEAARCFYLPYIHYEKILGVRLN